MSDDSKSIWPSVIIAAESANEPFEDVDIVTAQSEYIRQAYASAVSITQGQSPPPTADTIASVAQALSLASKVWVQERVTVSDNGKITICVNVPDLSDDSVLWYALDLIAPALDQLDGAAGTVFFGENLQFDWATIQPVNEYLRA